MEDILAEFKVPPTLTERPDSPFSGFGFILAEIESCHQPPEANYIEAFAKVGIP